MSAGSTLALLANPLPDVRLHAVNAQDSRVSRVHVHRFDPAETDAAAAVKSTVLAATDFRWLRAGDSVFVKVASNSAYEPPAVTSPAAVLGTVQALREAGAGAITVGDMSGAFYVRHLADETIGSTRENMRQNGLLNACESAGAQVHCFEEVPFESAYVPGVPPGEHHWGHDLYVAEVLDRVDHIVNLPRLGKHLVAGASLGLKNAVGWISDHSRMVLHRDADTFHEKIAEINAIPQLAKKTRLTLTLADRALTTEGPDSGYVLPLETPLIVASEDLVSHDEIALLTLLWTRQRTPSAALEADRYLSDGDGLNWWFVRVTWGGEAAVEYKNLPVYADLVGADTPTHIHLAYNLLQGGRPDRIEIIPGGLGLAADFIDLLTRDPALHIAVV